MSRWTVIEQNATNGRSLKQGRIPRKRMIRTLDPLRAESHQRRRGSRSQNAQNTFELTAPVWKVAITVWNKRAVSHPPKRPHIDRASIMRTVPKTCAFVLLRLPARKNERLTGSSAADTPQAFSKSRTGNEAPREDRIIAVRFNHEQMRQSRTLKHLVKITRSERLQRLVPDQR